MILTKMFSICNVWFLMITRLSTFDYLKIYSVILTKKLLNSHIKEQLKKESRFIVTFIKVQRIQLTKNEIKKNEKNKNRIGIT